MRELTSKEIDTLEQQIKAAEGSDTDDSSSDGTETETSPAATTAPEATASKATRTIKAELIILLTLLIV